MTTNFTLRDFFVFLLTGLIFLGSIFLIFYDNIFLGIPSILEKYPSIKDISFIITLFFIPIIYLFGHIIGSLSYLCLKLYVHIDKIFKKKGKNIPKWKYKILMLFQRLLYRQRVVYAVIQYTKQNKDKCIFKTSNDFWTICALLQIQKKYTSAEYWNLLNEFFNSLNHIFFISMIIAFVSCHWIIGIIYFTLMLLTYYRARQYAELFVITVERLTIAELAINPNLDIQICIKL